VLLRFGLDLIRGAQAAGGAIPGPGHQPCGVRVGPRSLHQPAGGNLPKHIEITYFTGPAKKMLRHVRGVTVRWENTNTQIYILNQENHVRVQGRIQGIFGYRITEFD